jgi:mono/diheme cytochrome c family protein
MKPLSLMSNAALAALIAAGTPLSARAANPADLLNTYTAQAGAPAAPDRGQKFFTERHGHDWSCSSCHGAVPVQPGKHASTGKAISALAPAVSAQRFTDAAKAEKWFRRNCNDVVGRECTPTEKADILGWLMSLRP